MVSCWMVGEVVSFCWVVGGVVSCWVVGGLVTWWLEKWYVVVR